MKNVVPAEIEIQRITEIAPHTDGQKIVLRADTLLENERTELEIAVTTDLAPSMALALLATTAQARASRDELEPALDALAAAVVRSSSDHRLRLQLLFERGAVLPIDLDMEAAEALNRGLVEYLGSAQRRLAARRN